MICKTRKRKRTMRVLSDGNDVLKPNKRKILEQTLIFFLFALFGSPFWRFVVTFSERVVHDLKLLFIGLDSKSPWATPEAAYLTYVAKVFFQSALQRLYGRKLSMENRKKKRCLICKWWPCLDGSQNQPARTVFNFLWFSEVFCTSCPRNFY